MVDYLPEISACEAEWIWINKLHNKIKDDQDVNVRVLKAELVGQLPKGFDPIAIDQRLVMHATALTLPVLCHLDPEYGWADKTDAVIRCIRDILIDNPKLEQVVADNVIEKTKLSRRDVLRVFQLLRRIGNTGGFSPAIFRTHQRL
jgi:hypothetical protein